jgi:hypothetical protein
MADIFDSYDLADTWNEMFERPGVPRPHADHLQVDGRDQPGGQARIYNGAPGLSMDVTSLSPGSPEPYPDRR